MARWFVDYLRCAPLPLWVPDWLGSGTVERYGASRWPRRIDALVPRSQSGGLRVIVHGGSLAQPVAEPACQALAGARTARVVDIAWLGWAAGMSPRFWRVEAHMERTSARLSQWLDAGAREVQQWVCEDPLPVVVTLGHKGACD